jgi:hypothetical protein
LVDKLRNCYGKQLNLILSRKNEFARAKSLSMKAEDIQSFISINRSYVFVQLRFLFLECIQSYLSKATTINWNQLFIFCDLGKFSDSETEAAIFPKLNKHFEICYGWRLTMQKEESKKERKFKISKV